MGFAWLDKDGAFQQGNTDKEPKRLGTPYVEFERGALPAPPNILTISNGVILISNSKLISENQNKAKQERDSALIQPINLNGFFYDYDKNGKESIMETISEAELMGFPDTESQVWKLADNSQRETTLGELKQIVILGAARRRDVWTQYSTWLYGDRLTEFKVV